MLEVLRHVLWALAVLGLGAAALRLATRLVPAGPARAIATAVLAVAAAIAQALALGLVGLGANPVALTAAAGATWLAARTTLPAPDVRPGAEVARWWDGLPLPARAGMAAWAGLYGTLVVWMLRWPAIGFDSAVYHYPLVAGWIDNGRPGSVLDLSYDIPYGSYPLTDEVVLTWGAGIARSWVPIALWNPALGVLLILATWTCLRALRVAPLPAGLATAAIATTPIVVTQLSEAQTDLPAFTWLACVAALTACASAACRPALLAAAVVAAGLAVGTKPSTAPVVLAVLAAGAYDQRARLRTLVVPLAAAAAGAVVVGGLWYLRNLVQHGSPLWPFVDAPWGDPSPRFLSLPSRTLLQHPVETLDGRLHEYTSRFAGALLLAFAGLVVALAGALGRSLPRRQRRAMVLAGGLSVAAWLIWSMAWGTGRQPHPELASPDGWSISAMRYAFPAIGAAAVAVALATRARGRTGAVATLALGVAIVLSLVGTARLGAPSLPRLTTLVGGVAAGLAVLAISELAARRGMPPLPRPPAVAVASVLGALLTVAGHGYLERHTRLDKATVPGTGVVSWLLDQPGFGDGDDTVAFASRIVLGTATGEDLEHPLRLVAQRPRCADVLELARRAYVVVTPPIFFKGLQGLEPYTAQRCLRGERPVHTDGVFRVYRLR